MQPQMRVGREGVFVFLDMSSPASVEIGTGVEHPASVEHGTTRHSTDDQSSFSWLDGTGRRFPSRHRKSDRIDSSGGFEPAPSQRYERFSQGKTLGIATRHARNREQVAP